MPARPRPPTHVSIEDYLADERGSDIRHEYLDGQMYAMTGASDRHGLIVNAIAYALTPAARRQHCQLFTSDMKLRMEISGATFFYYPDVLLACNPHDRETWWRQSPCLLVEVLSESTARIDRREKLLAYQSLPSLEAYLLVEQDLRRVELHRRDNGWRAEYIEEGTVPLACLHTELALDDIYADVPAL